MTTNKNEVKQWFNIFHVIVNANSIVRYSIQIKNRIIVNPNVSVKGIIHAKKDCNCNSRTCI